MPHKLIWVRRLAIGVIVAFSLMVAALFVRQELGAREVQQLWEDRTRGTVLFDTSAPQLTVTPLINWHTTRDQLRSEPGVSLLIETGHERILFDLAFNQHASAVSPLETNVRALGIDLSDIDRIFLSHRHRDHMGGTEAERDGRIAIGDSLGVPETVSVIASVSLPKEPRPVTEAMLPSPIGLGVATTGPIPRQLFAGRIDEQALVVNLAGKGLVLVVGCGHQTVEKLITRVQESFKQPIYAIVGDLHFPIPRGRLSILGLDAQRLLASGEGPLSPVGLDDVRSLARWAAENRVRLYLGGHDTSDEVLSFLNQTPGVETQVLKVGNAYCLSC